MCHMSHATFHVSLNLIFVIKVDKLVGGGSVINVAYPVYSSVSVVRCHMSHVMRQVSHFDIFFFYCEKI